MSREDDLRAAVAAGALGAQSTHVALLRSIVDVARAIFASQAASIMLYDEPAAELVFAAVAGEGAASLLGRRLPASSGIAGWVLSARQPLVVEDVAADPRFARGVAESTGYVPKGLMAAPLLLDERVLGVLSVLDRPQRASFSLAEMDLLGLFAHQAALALDLVEHARTARDVLDAAEGAMSDLAAVAAALDRLDGDRRQAGIALIAALRAVLA